MHIIEGFTTESLGELRKGRLVMFSNTKTVKDFDNVLTEVGGIHYSRYIVSWLKRVLRHKDILMECNYIDVIFGDDFVDWLASEGLTEEEIDRVKWMATNGKMELETSANKFINNL
jgi:hypothetical protein